MSTAIHRIVITVLLLTSVCAARAAPDPATAPVDGAQEYALLHAGQRVGTLRIEDSASGRTRIHRDSMEVHVAGQQRTERWRIDTEVRTDRIGHLLSARMTSRTGSIVRSSSARVRGDSLLLRTGPAGQTVERQVPLDGPVLHGAALAAPLESLLQGWVGEQQAQWFDAFSMRLRQDRLRLRSRAQVLAGMPVQLLAAGVASGQVRAVWLSGGARMLTPLRIWNKTLDLLPCGARCTGSTHALDLLAGTLVESPVRIPAAALSGAIRYRFAGMQADQTVFARTSEQSVSASDDGIEVTVCETCGGEPAPGAQELRALRMSSTWVNSNDPSIRRLARKAMRGSLDARMRRLEAITRERLDGEIDLLGYLSASEAFRARRGDCTETALLLAALARAQGIPARVVSGIAYSSRFTGKAHVFSPHMWVQVWDGTRWRSYDAGMGPFGSGHIALRIGDGRPEAYEGVVDQIEQLELLAAHRVRTAGN